MLKEMMEAEVDKLTNGSNKLEMEMIIEKQWMRKAVILKKEKKVVKLFNQNQRAKTILLDLHLEVEMNK